MKGIGPNRLGAPKSAAKMGHKSMAKMKKVSNLSQMKAKSPMQVGHEDKSMAKIMKKSPMEIGMKPKSPAKKSTRVSNKEKAAMMAKKRAAGTDAASMRRRQLNTEVKKQLRGKSTFGAAGKEAEKKAVAIAEKELDKKRAKSPAKIVTVTVDKKKAKKAVKKAKKVGKAVVKAAIGPGGVAIAKAAKKAMNKKAPKSPAMIAKGKKSPVKKAGKMPMAKDPKTGKMVPAFAIDGKGKS